MASRFLAIGTLTIVAAMATATAVSTFRHTHVRPSAAPGPARLKVFGSRSAAQLHSASGAKFDGALADLSRHAALIRPDHAIEDLHSLSPAARFMQTAAGATPLVLIDAVTRGDPQALKAALVGLGLQHASVYSNDVSGWLPVTALDAATERAEVHSIRAAMPRTRIGAVTSQGDFAEHSDVARAPPNTLDGTGVTVGVLSDSYDCYATFAMDHVAASGAAGYASNGFLATAATDVMTLDLPAGVTLLLEAPCMQNSTQYNGYPDQLPFGDEGRAMLQIVHDVAPGANLAFYTAENGEADFANGIAKLAAATGSGGAGAKVIADDVGYFDEPFFQDGIIAQAIATVTASGVAYFTAAGNNGSLAYDNAAPSFSTTSTAAPNKGEKLLNFDTSGSTNTTSLPVTIAALVPGEFVSIIVQWDQPYVTGAPDSGGATSHIDVCITGASGSDDVISYASGNTATCSGPNTTGADSYQIMIVGIPANASGNSAAETLNIQVGLADGTAAPGRIKIAVEDDGAGSTINAFKSNGGTIQGHSSAAGAATLGAAFYLNTPACGTTPAALEDFSSRGGTPILFDSSGTRLTTPVLRQKPDFTGPNGGNDTFLGFTLTGSNAVTSTIAGCENDVSFPNFFGTSAATPHAAAIAALMLQAKPLATPTEIYQALRASALPMADASPNQQSGYGFIQANTALAVPTLTLGATTLAVGGTTSLTWSTINATSCVASGNDPNWTGTLAANGTQMVTLATSGTNTYTLTCTNGAGTSAANTVYLTSVVPAEPTLTITATSINLGQSATISWSSATAASCTASGSWSGPLPTSGSEIVTPSAGGTKTYSLICANAVGPSPANSVTLAVDAPPVAPTLTLTAPSIAVGSSTTISWSSVNATSCTASGTWTGTLATSGTQTLTPTTEGAYTYSLICSNAAGASAATSVTLTVTVAATAATLSGHGGALDGLTLLALAALALAGWVRSRRAQIESVLR
jgi:hypothetical protein